MIVPDVIVSWPKNCDYPLWRKYIHENRQRFNEVIVVFTETHSQPDYSQFVTDAMFGDYVHFIHSRPVVSGEDWRNVAVNEALVHSYNAEWVWFTEQDFLPKDGFWEEVQKCGRDVIGVLDGERLHPCSLFIRRNVLKELKKDFGIVPDRSDHFGRIQQQLGERHEFISIIPPHFYNHMAGLSQNWRLLTNGDIPNHKPEEFKQYLKDCLASGMALDERFVEVAKKGV